MARQATRPALAELQAKLADPDYKVRKEAIRKMVRYYRTQATAALFNILKDNNGYMRAYAAKMLAQAGDAHAVGPLLDALADKHSLVRVQAARAIYKLAPQQAITPLIALLTDESSRVQGIAANLLGQSGNTRSVPALIACLPNAKVSAKGQVVYALGRLRDPRAIAPLFALLETSGAESFAWYAVEALKMIGGEQAFQGLLLLVKDPKALLPARTYAVHALAGIKPSEAVPELLAALESGDDAIINPAINALANLGDSRAIAPLIALLNQKNEQHTLEAIYALGRMKATGAIEDVIPLLNSTSDVIVAAAAYFLGQSQDQRVVAPLINALSDSDQENDFALVRALGDLGYSEAFEALAQIVRKSSQPHLRITAIEALSKLGDIRMVEVLLERLEQPVVGQYYWHEMGTIIWILGRAGDARAIKPLQMLMKQDYAQNHLQEPIRHALRYLGATEEPLSV